MKEKQLDDLYYIYRIQYEDLIHDLDYMIERLEHNKFSKDKIIIELNKIIRDSYDKTYLLKSNFNSRSDE